VITSFHNPIARADTLSALVCSNMHARPAISAHAHHRGVCRAQDLEWTVSMSSSEEDLEDNVFTQQRSLFKSGLDAFMVALHRWGVKAQCSPQAHHHTADSPAACALKTSSGTYPGPNERWHLHAGRLRCSSRWWRWPTPSRRWSRTCAPSCSGSSATTSCRRSNVGTELPWLNLTHCTAHSSRYFPAS
jgi:hypothetical protein